jgi:hypothetical protein
VAARCIGGITITLAKPLLFMGMLNTAPVGRFRLSKQILSDFCVESGLFDRVLGSEKLVNVICFCLDSG